MYYYHFISPVFLDTVLCCMLAVSLRVLHWLTHLVNVNFTLDSVCHSVVGLGASGLAHGITQVNVNITPCKTRANFAPCTTLVQLWITCG